MANLIIKSSADDLVLQGSDASPAITVGATGTTTFAEATTMSANVTMSGTANNVGTVTAGTFNSTIGSSASLNHDAQKYAWHRFVSNAVDISSAANIDFDSSIFLGSGLTESAGVITISAGGAGLYWVSCSISYHDVNNRDIDFNLRINSTNINGTRLYINTPPSNGTGYGGITGSWPARLADGDTVSIYGQGHYSGGATDSMTWFTGVRIGAKT